MKHYEDQLVCLESVIESNQRNFYAVGKALKEIRDKRLYRTLGFDLLELYTRSRWDMGKSHTYRLIEASVVIDNLSAIGESLPLNEAQVRSLTNFEPFEQRKIWREFLKSGHDMTARHIRKFISDYLGKQRPLPAPDRIEVISENYRSAVMKMLYQIRKAQSDEWQLTSLEAAVYWNNIMKERILWGKK
jgi:hypothetical protein